MSDSQIPKSARIASWLGKFAPSCALSGLALVQFGAIPPLGGYMFFLLGLLCAPLSLGFGTAAFFATRANAEGPGRNGAWLGLASGMVMIAATVAGAGPGLNSPPINDITTNLEDPPAFATPEQVPDYRGRDMSYPPEFVEIVREHYPYLEPIEVSDTPEVAYAKAIDAVEELGWVVAHEREDELSFDAQIQSAVFKFVDDMTVRIRPSERGATIDVRSKSRDGKGDIGANARHIMALAAMLKN